MTNESSGCMHKFKKAPGESSRPETLGDSGKMDASRWRVETNENLVLASTADLFSICASLHSCSTYVENSSHRTVLRKSRYAFRGYFPLRRRVDKSHLDDCTSRRGGGGSEGGASVTRQGRALSRPQNLKHIMVPHKPRIRHIGECFSLITNTA